MILEKLWGTIGRCGTVLLALLLLDGGSVTGQVFYNNFSGSLLQLNPDGTSTPIQIGNLPFAGEPVFSNDGRFLAVRSVDPNRQNQLSTNIYVLDRVNGGLQQITNFVDATDPDTGNTVNQAPLYKASSPDGSPLLVLSNVNVKSNNQNEGTTVFVSIHQVSALVPPLEGPFAVGMTDALSTVGLGASWSVSSNVLAIPNFSLAQNATTAIIGQLDGPNGLTAGNLTFPEQLFGQVSFSDYDCFPSFSPDGESLAYFRVRRQIFGVQPQPALVSIRISDANGDRSIFSDFAPGLFPTGLSWTPDASQLVFSIATQEPTGGFFGLFSQAGTSQVVTINVDGTGIRQLVPQGINPAVAPVLGPGNAGDTILGDVNQDDVVNFGDIPPFIDVLGGGGFQAEADCNEDGAVDFSDIPVFIEILIAS